MCYLDPKPYYHSMMMRIHDEMHPVTELLIVRRRKESHSPEEGVVVDGFLVFIFIVYF